MSGREEGTAALELTLGVAVLLVPLLMAVAMLPGWLEQESVTAMAAREGARAFVLASEPRQAFRDADAVARRIADEHGIDARDFSVHVSGALSRGTSATVTTRVRVPLARIPLLGRFGRFTITRRHSEIVDSYRSW